MGSAVRCVEGCKTQRVACYTAASLRRQRVPHGEDLTGVSNLSLCISTLSSPARTTQASAQADPGETRHAPPPTPHLTTLLPRLPQALRSPLASTTCTRGCASTRLFFCCVPSSLFLVTRYLLFFAPSYSARLSPTWPPRRRCRLSPLILISAAVFPIAPSLSSITRLCNTHHCTLAFSQYHAAVRKRRTTSRAPTADSGPSLLVCPLTCFPSQRLLIP